MYKTLYILIFSTLLFSYSDSENLDSTNLRKQNPIRLAPVMIDNGLWGYINQEGKIVIKPQFSPAEDFSEGLACVATGGQWGYINQEGKFVIKPQFGNANSFSEGLAYAATRDKRGYINKEGKFVIILPRLHFVHSNFFSEGLVHRGKKG